LVMFHDGASLLPTGRQAQTIKSPSSNPLPAYRQAGIPPLNKGG
jgi:hypothetical protein